MRQAAKRDNTEPEIIRALTVEGIMVCRNSEKGKPDLTATWLGTPCYVECKSKGGSLTAAQLRFLEQDLGDMMIVIAQDGPSAVQAVKDAVHGRQRLQLAIWDRQANMRYLKNGKPSGGIQNV